MAIFNRVELPRIFKEEAMKLSEKVKEEIEACRPNDALLAIAEAVEKLQADAAKKPSPAPETKTKK